MGLFTSLAAVGLLCSLPVHCARAPADTFLFPGRDSNAPFVRKPEENFLKGGFIVQYKGDAQNFSELSGELTKRGLPPKHRFDFNHDLFHGCSFTLDETENPDRAINDIMATGNVEKVWPLRLMRRDPGLMQSKLPAGAKHGSPKLAKRASQDKLSTHVMTGVDKLHAQGLTGKGTFVAILDTGVDYKHPDLGGGFGHGHKIAKGYDFVGDNAHFGNPKPDNDPYESCGLHGTWASGIVAANPGLLNAPGVAPQATLGMYRIFDCLLWTSEDIVMSAYLKAYDDGADVISLSFGSYSGVHDDPLGLVVSKIVSKGVICVAASGEAGGPPFQANSPASALGVLSVGTVENTVKPIFRFLGNYSVPGGKNQIFEYEPTDIPLTKTRNLWTWNYTMDFADPYSLLGCPDFPDNVPDLKENVVLVPFCLGTMLDAIGLGVKYLMLHDHGEILPAVATKSDDVLSGFGIVTRQQGNEWQSDFLKGAHATLTFTDPEHPEYRYREVPNEVGGSVNLWSSWGPTLELDPAPMVSAPGGNVLATLPKRDGFYGVLSRAGGAAPYAAGVAALLKQNNKKINPKSVLQVLSTTANPMKFNDGKSSDDTFAPPIQQGGGLINAHSAIHTKSTISETHIKVGGKKDTMITLRNNGDKEQTYSISHQASHTVYTVFSDLQTRGTLPEIASAGAVLSFPQKLKVGPKATVKFQIQFKPPNDLAKERVPIYSGHIIIKEQGGAELSVPYLGSPTNPAEIEPFHKPSTYLAATDDISKKVDPDRVFQFPRGNITDIEDFNLPIMMVGLDFYTSDIQAEIIPEHPIEGFKGKLGGGEPFGPFPPGLLIPIPVFGNLASGKMVPEGKFTVSVKGIKYLGDKGASKFQQLTSSSFGVQYVGQEKKGGN
ncbi:hypothetical protein PRK78_007173 [Emydomyces testavorans]|uniref:Subtilisin-like protein n=1 Tax=Emydomyces testavorans TaxID=2070801 RepID=A0AAF0DMS0_9EURO|nr:hypothetical protein PRK78_007173 [Emydomyces testavorans]